jgi:hypothetical protein
MKIVINLPVRLTVAEKAAIKAKAALCGMHLADYVAAAVKAYDCASDDQATNRPVDNLLMGIAADDNVTLPTPQALEVI